MELGAEPMPVAPGAPGGLKLSNGGNWKGSETGTRPPNIPKPRGRAEGLPRRGVPAVDTCQNTMQLKQRSMLLFCFYPFTLTSESNVHTQ